MRRLGLAGARLRKGVSVAEHHRCGPCEVAWAALGQSVKASWFVAAAGKDCKGTFCSAPLSVILVQKRQRFSAAARKAGFTGDTLSAEAAGVGSAGVANDCEIVRPAKRANDTPQACPADTQREN